MDEYNQPAPDWDTQVFRVASPCGREYTVPLQAVRQDYVRFLMEEDGISQEKALDQACFDYVQTWFLEQFNWADVEQYGQCVKQSTPQQITEALNLMRGGAGPSDKCVLEESAELVATRDAGVLDRSTGQASSHMTMKRF